MLSSVVERGHYTKMRRKALKEPLLKRYREQLEAADPKEKKRILAQIDAEVEEALSEEMKRWNQQQGPTWAQFQEQLTISWSWAGIAIIFFVLAVLAFFWKAV